MRRNFFIIIASCLLVTFTIVYAQSGKTPDIYQTEKGEIQVEQIAQNLDTAWAMAMLPNGELIVTLRDGKMVIVNPDKPKTHRNVGNVPSVKASGQGGLLDVILDRDFEQNKRIYFTYSERAAGGKTGTALASAVLNNGSRPSLEEVNVLYAMKNKTTANRHFGSRIVQARDGTLFFTIGDRGAPPRAQNPLDAAGSVIRVATDGSIPADNPFANDNTVRAEIWSIGHRNPQGATLNDDTGEVWTLSHGPRGGDEINVPEPGKNYGWPSISYGTNYSGSKVGLGTSSPGFEQPKYFWDPSIAPSGFDFYQGDEIPFWKGDLFAGSLKYGHISRLEVDGDKITHEEQVLSNEYGRIRDVRYFADGALWFLTDDSDGGIYRIVTQ